MCALSEINAGYAQTLNQDADQLTYSSYHIDQQLLINRLWKEGYWYAGVDSITSDSLYVHVGNQLFEGDFNLQVTDANGEVLVDRQVASSKELHPILDDLLSKYAESGYPFVSAVCDSIGHTISKLNFHIQLGPLVVFDTLVIEERANISHLFISRVLDIASGDMYNDQTVEEIQNKISRLRHFNLQSSPEVHFENNKASVFLDLVNKSRNSFEGIVGIQPNAFGQSLITGALDFQIGNLMQKGRELDLNWSKFNNQSQSLLLKYDHPLLFYTPVNFNSGFQLMRQDTSFINQTFEISASLPLAKSHEFSIGYTKKAGSVVDISPEKTKEGIVDYKINFYNLIIKSRKFENLDRTTKSFDYQGIVSIGDKNIPTTNRLSLSHGDSLKQNSLIWKWQLDLQSIMPISRQLVVYHSLMGMYQINPEILTNERSRVGGLKSMRGFSENEFLVKNYVLSNLELRQYFQESSYFYLLYDFAALSELEAEIMIHSIGGGLTLETSKGMFTFAAARGMSIENYQSSATTKIHIGYISFF